MQHCVTPGVLIPHRELGKILPTAEAKDLKCCVRGATWGLNENYAKVGHRGSGAGSRDLLGNFGTPLRISGLAEAKNLKFCMRLDGCGP